ncbi:aldo/keto reductase [Bacillus bingmayongensis]|uniref:aldo/keto reductase n=1 Tax=Bacillus bingmayongensis TaxID=1150157 RepID=UPI001C8DCFA6|nr:aldo/keto reductase [Bacillus bingmayongensis]MBY0600233.1 aldo/keto reductase [Bacillus bingmayongensis]
MTNFKKNNYVSKLTLGTAQLGNHYGIANKTGMPTREKSLEIIDYAICHGVDSLDTASGYGDSEVLIGEYIESQKLENTEKIPSVITKIPSVHSNSLLTFDERYQFMEKTISDSLARLRLSQLDSCLLHDPLDIIAHHGEVVQHLIKFKKNHLVKKIGVSVYEPKEIETVIELDCFDVIQVPINIFDQRLIKTGLLKKLCASNIEIYGRSIYLQGLLLMSPSELPDHLKDAKIPLNKLEVLAKELRLSVMEMAMLYIRDLPEILKIIIGCETMEQLKHNLQIINLPPLTESIVNEIQDVFQDLPNKIIDPRKWS